MDLDIKHKNYGDGFIFTNTYLLWNLTKEILQDKELKTFGKVQIFWTKRLEVYFYTKRTL